MPYKIPLYFLSEFPEDESSSTRLFAWVSLKSLDDYLDPMKAIIDTGAPFSLIPFKIWGQADVIRGEPGAIHTVSDRPECDIGVTHGEATLAFLNDDWEQILTDVTIAADLCDTSEMPFILGMSDFLKLGRLVMDYPANEAWLELKKPPS